MPEEPEEKDVYLCAVGERLKRRAYQNPDDVVGRALEVLHSEDEWLHDHKLEIAEKIERAFEQFERGEFLSAEESRADMERRKAAWLAEQIPDGVAVRRFRRSSEPPV